MFNLNSPSSTRCNGLLPNMAKQTAGRVSHQRSITTSASSAGSPEAKLKYSEQLKVPPATSYDEIVIKSEPLDDPYTFEDTETFHQKPNKPVSNNVQSRRLSLPNSSKLNSLLTDNRIRNSLDTKIKIEPVDSYEPNVQNDNCKTLNRLQARIARNKLTVKHNKESPEYTGGTRDKWKTLAPSSSVSNLLHSNESDTKPSIIELSEAVKNITVRKLATGKPLPAHLKARRANLKSTHHEVLQRIRRKRPWHAPQVFDSDVSDSDGDEGVPPIYQRVWFVPSAEEAAGVSINRDARLSETKADLQRYLSQMQKGAVGKTPPMKELVVMAGAARTNCRIFGSELLKKHHPGYRDSIQNRNASIVGLLKPQRCSFDEDGESCTRQALPCTRHCARHIMHNADQLLYDYCTAKFADNTQCCVPVFDINHELPLCTEHARKRDNYNRMCQETKPKKPRKKAKPSAMIRPQKRSKKRRKPPSKSSEKSHHKSSISSLSDTVTENTDVDIGENIPVCDSPEKITASTELVSCAEFGEDEPDEDVVARVLGVENVEELPLELASSVELASVEQSLVTQASRLLEETDITNVLSQIPPDAFNELFIDRNGVYEPTMEETEELERALEAVDQDVKSLEKLSQTQGLLDSLLDEHALVESLAQIPDVFNHHGTMNGFNVNANLNAGSSAATTVIPARSIVTPVVNGLENIMSVQPQAHTPS